MTNFQNPSVPGNTAFIGYAVSPQGDIASLALVLQNGVPNYALNDYKGELSTVELDPKFRQLAKVDPAP
jgi:hypothetical protein